MKSKMLNILRQKKYKIKVNFLRIILKNIYKKTKEIDSEKKHHSNKEEEFKIVIS